MQTFDIGIHGDGIVGKTLALLLAQQGRSLAWVRAGARAQEDIRAYALNAASVRTLEAIGAWPRAMVSPVQKMAVSESSGGFLDFGSQSNAQPVAFILDAADLERALDEQLLRYADRIAVLDALPRVKLHAICEGRNSALGASWGADYQTHDYGQRAIAARLRVAIPHENIARQWFDQDGQVLALLPRANAQEMALVWSLRRARAQDYAALPTIDFMAHLRAATGGVLGDLELQGQLASWDLRLTQAGQWTGRNAHGTWALLGDAAHTVHPLAGQGLNLGLADAFSFAQALQDKPAFRSIDDARLWRQWARSRRAQYWTIRGFTDGLFQLFQNEHATVQTVRRLGMQGFHHARPLKQYVMRLANGQVFI